MRTKELIVAELLKNGNLTAEDAAILLDKEYINLTPAPVYITPYVTPLPLPPWYPTITFTSGTENSGVTRLSTTDGAF